MKIKILASTTLALILFGCAGPPTKFEQGFMNVQTNTVPVVVVSNGVPIITQAEEYHYTPGPGAQQARQVATDVGNLFGVGGLVGTAFGLLTGLWGFVRSSRTYRTAANLSQSIETMRQFIQQLPNGAQYDAALVSWLQAHQAEGNVMQQVLQLLQSQVSNPDARVAAQDIMNTIQALQGLTPAAPKAKV